MMSKLMMMAIKNLREGGEGDLESAGTLSAFPESFLACNVIKVDIIDIIDIIDIVGIIDIVDIINIIDIIVNIVIIVDIIG